MENKIFIKGFNKKVLAIFKELKDEVNTQHLINSRNLLKSRYPNLDVRTFSESEYIKFWTFCVNELVHPGMGSDKYINIRWGFKNDNGVYKDYDKNIIDDFESFL